MSYKNLAIDALSKATGYDPYLSTSEVMVAAWTEALSDAGIDNRDDVLMAVRVMYRVHGDPGWRPTPKIFIEIARECRDMRIRREGAEAEKAGMIEGAERITFAEWRKRHPDIPFPKTFGKRVPRG